jgi:hypothetical protein
MDWSDPPRRALAACSDICGVFPELGAAGVALFFMTTDLVFTRVSWRVFAHARSRQSTHRVFRIVPLIIFSVAIITFITYLRTGNGFDGKYPMAAAQWIIGWDEPPLLGYEDSYRFNADVFWFEWLFYIFLLPCFALMMDLTRVYVSSYVLPIGLLFASIVFLSFMSTSLFVFLPLFATGMCAYELRRNEKIVQKLRTTYYRSLPLFVFFFVCVACGNSMWGLFANERRLGFGRIVI